MNVVLASPTSRLVVATAILLVVWLVILPWAGRRPAIDRHVRAMEEGGVNPAAMFYTELERLPLRPPWTQQHLVLWPEWGGPLKPEQATGETASSAAQVPLSGP